MTGEPGEHAKPRILFVDDDPRILSGLQSLLRKDRGRWEMVFASGGKHALEELGKARFDVVVTDMRMPDVDGASVLHAAAEASPWTRRILLTGYTDDETLARVRPVLDQLLDKPCSVSALRQAIDGPPSRGSTGRIRATRGGMRQTLGPHRR